MKITHVNSGEVKFKQGDSIINYGDATISTYNLVNCLAIGGRFNYKEADLKGIFFTHESPTDKEKQKEKLQKIKDILKDNLITDIFIFRIEPSQAAKDRYSDGSTTEEIIAEMIRFTQDIFGLEPNILSYTCDIKTFRCGKASISLDSVRTNLESITINSNSVTEDTSNVFGTFEPTYLKNKDGDTIVQCPICESKSGTLLRITHNYNCPNKGKKENLSHKPTEGGSRNKKRKTYKSSKKSQKRISRHTRWSKNK
jgi:hypothetical protein